MSDNTNAPISITGSDSDSELRVKSLILDLVIAQVKDYAIKIGCFVFVVIVGAIAASLWGLNGEIYKAVGKTEVSTKVYETEIGNLKEEVADLKKQIHLKDCMENKKVSNKGSCYHDN